MSTTIKDALRPLEAKMERLQAERDEAVRVSNDLSRYADHLPYCPRARGATALNCTCGLAELRKHPLLK